ncbi:hypothetical protein M422DRAFT_220080 [Sphaerobolus stellatus SS14]|nr:hypothetical protein M422DRAFT_220080 [Sphaerobolus stellatus SS14]
MPRAEVGTPKHLANKMKSKGLQRLRWYCQVCEKQCRDENGFKCHTISEGHLRQMLVVGEHAGKHIQDFSAQFQSEFVAMLSRRFGTKRVKANTVYQEYIHDKSHLHMNATRWVTLTEFIKHLGRSGIARVDETDKGWFIAWIDNSPQALAKQDAQMKKERLTMSDEQRERILIAEQIERAKAEDGEANEEEEKEKAKIEGLKRDENTEKVVLSLSLKPSVSASTSATAEGTSAPAAAPLKINPLKAPSMNPLKMNPLKGPTVNPLKRPNVFKSSPLTSGSSSKSEDSNSKKRPLSNLEGIILEDEERKRRKMEREARS